METWKWAAKHGNHPTALYLATVAASCLKKISPHKNWELTPHCNEILCTQFRESWLCFTVLEELCPIFACYWSCFVCLPLVMSTYFRCMSFISGIEACPAPSVRQFGSVLWESGKLTVKGYIRFWMVALRLPKISLHLLAFSLLFLHNYSIFKNLTFICRSSCWVHACLFNNSSIKSYLPFFFFFKLLVICKV